MVLTAGTIHDVLARRNPTLDVKTGKGSLSKDPGWEGAHYSLIKPWDEFNYQNLVNGWGHILSIQGAKGKFEDEISNSQKEIIDEDKIDSVAEIWNVECLRDPLKKGAERIRGTPQPDVTIRKKYMQYTGPKCPKKKKMEPDMAIFLKDGTRTSCTTLVMGDNKCATKWSHRAVTRSTKEQSKELLWPIRQIVTYCVHARTRYGYIMTTSEVVVFRVSKNASTSDPIKHTVEWNHVPWSNNGEGQLTVNLAIWWLGMLGLIENHRAIVMPRQLLPINSWQKSIKDKTDTYTHILGGCTRKTFPPGNPHIS
ncbi:hypothetical protein N0V82_008715 [Gnomoniopsis sp. IMI 355080]|nr:hypothetical protein N0V82_008715 [Gnomoniopsis sp. IMI 355080]